MYHIEEVKLPNINTGVIQTKYAVISSDGTVRKIWSSLKGAEKQVRSFNKIANEDLE